VLTEHKVRKLLGIALAVLGVVKAAGRQAVPVDSEVQAQIHLLMKNCEQ